jgi:hypothetical protein
MSVPWNTSGISVFECSWLPMRWHFSVWHAGGFDMGGAASEEEAWEKARAIARFHHALPQEGTP